MDETTVILDTPEASVILDGPEGNEVRITQDGEDRIYQDTVTELVNF